MICLTRLNGTPIFINEKNIQWIENLPDTAITFLGGAKLFVKETILEIEKIWEQNLQHIPMGFDDGVSHVTPAVSTADPS